MKKALSLLILIVMSVMLAQAQTEKRYPYVVSGGVTVSIPDSKTVYIKNDNNYTAQIEYRIEGDKKLKNGKLKKNCLIEHYVIALKPGADLKRRTIDTNLYENVRFVKVEGKKSSHHFRSIYSTDVIKCYNM